MRSSGIPAEKLAELRELSPNAAIFTSLPSSERDKPASDYDTVTAEENEDSLLPEPLTSLFDYNAINMEGVLLQEFAVKKFSDYESCFNQDLYDRLTAITISQSLSNVWRLHRVGRITASNFYDVIHCKSGKSKTLLNKLMNYVAVPPNLPSIVYGREMEAVAKKSYTDLVKKYHENLMVFSTGLHINVKYPHLDDLLMVLLSVIALEKAF